MRSLKIACLGLAVVLATVGSASAQRARLGLRLPQESELNPVGLTRAWWAHAVTDSLRDKLLYLTLDDENLYAQSSNGVITCFNNETGQRRWSVRIGLTDSPTFPLTMNSTHVFASSSSKLYCLKKSNGNIAWELRFPGPPSVSPAVDNFRVYIGTIDGSVYAFDHRKIAKLEEQGLMPQWSNETLLWRYKTPLSIVSPPMPVQHLVSFASESGSIYSVGAEKRDLIFQYKTAAKLSAPMTLYKRTLLIPAQDNIFYAISVDHGTSLWEFTVGVPIKRSPVAVNNKAYVMPLKNGMYQLNADTGEKLWWRNGIEQFLAQSPRRVYGKDYMGNLIVMDEADGGILGAVDLTNYTKYLVNDQSDRIYVATEGGLIVCLREPARTFPVFHKHPERLPIMPVLAPPGKDPPEIAPPKGGGDEAAPAEEK